MILGCLQSETVPAAAEHEPRGFETSECMMLADLTTPAKPGDPTSLDALVTFEHAGGRMTCLTVAELGHRSADAMSIHVFSGSSGGQLSAVPIQIPTRAGSKLEDIVVQGGVQQTDAGFHATVGRRLHRGAIAAVSFCRETCQLATAGADGRLTVITAREDGPVDLAAAAVRELAAGSACRSFADVCFTRTNELVSIGTAGGVQVWDVRCAGAPVQASPAGWCKGRAITCVVPHPASPQLCVTGHADASVALWDMRFIARPDELSLASHGAAGAVRARFDRSRAGTARVPLVACTSTGQLFELSLGEAGGAGAAVLLAEEDCALVALDVDPLDGSKVAACSDCESLLVVDRQQRNRG